MTDKPKGLTEVLVKINEQTIVGPKKLHLNVDVITVKDGKPDPRKNVSLELGESRRTVHTSENGVAEDENIIFDFIHGTRLKLRVWVDEVEKSNYDVSPDGYEENIREEIEHKVKEESDAEKNKAIAQIESAHNEQIIELESLIRELTAEIKELKPQKNDILVSKSRKILSQEASLEVSAGEEMVIKTDSYEVRNDIVIQDGGKLTIEPGTELFFGQTAGLICHGQLCVEGQKGAEITFDELEKGKGWKNITLFGKGANNSALTNCTIRNGRGEKFVIDADDPTKIFIKPNFFDDELSVCWGGGMAVIDVDSIELHNVVIENCKVHKTNKWQSPQGGGVMLLRSKGKLKNCHITHNKSDVYGGGIYTGEGSSLELEECDLDSNQATHGGGIFVGSNGNNNFSKTSIRCNKAEKGGGIFLAGTVNATDLAIKENESRLGGGIYCDIRGQKITLMKCQITNNKSQLGAGMFVTDECAVHPLDANRIFTNPYQGTSFENLDIRLNEASSTGAGVYIQTKPQYEERIETVMLFFGKTVHYIYLHVPNFLGSKISLNRSHKGFGGVHIGVVNYRELSAMLSVDSLMNKRDLKTQSVLSRLGAIIEANSPQNVCLAVDVLTDYESKQDYGLK